MNCAEVMDLLLDAEPDELEVGVEAVFAEHLQTCSRCRAAAAKLAQGHAALASVLADVRPRLEANEVVDRVLVAAEEKHGAGRRGRVRHLPWAALPLAAAAALAVLLLHPRGGEFGPGPPFAEPLAEDHAVPLVEVPAGRNAAVFQTRNPKITVVWLY